MIVPLDEELLDATGRPAGKGLGGAGSVAAVCISTSLCGAEGSLCSSGGDASTIRPAEKGRGGEGSLITSTSSVGNRDRAKGTLSSSGFPSTKRCLGESLGCHESSSTIRPAGNGLGGEGSAVSSSSIVGNRDSGSLSASWLAPSSAYLGKGLGGEGSCGTDTSFFGMEAGRAIVPAMRRAKAGERNASFMVVLCVAKG